MATQVWDLWIPDAGSRGISFGRGVMDEADRVIVHSAPSRLRVEVREEDGGSLAFGDNLARTEESPMTLLVVEGDRVTRRDFWPTAADIGAKVLLPGGEVGILTQWWNAPDHSAWRWSVEFANHR